jgi:mannosyltransferase
MAMIETPDRVESNKGSVVFFVGLGALILFALALRLFHLGTQDIWWDEARNIFTAGRPLAQIASAKELDIHPPFYFYLLHFWTALAGTSEFAVRFLSLWFGVATVALAYRLGVYVTDRHVGWWVGFLVALSPLFVDEAQQTRMYTLVIFLSTLSIYLLLRATNTQKRTYWIGYVLAAAASFYVHYSFIYILAAQNLYLALELVMRWRHGHWRHDELPRSFFLRWAGSQLAIAFLYIWQVPNILRQLQIYGNAGMTPPSLRQYVSDLAQAFLVGQKVDVNRIQIAELAIVAALVLALIGVLFRRRAGLTTHNAGMLAIWCAVPLIAYFVVLQKSPQFTPRYIMIAALPFYFLLALALAELSRRTIALGGLSALLLFGSFAGAWQSMYFSPAFLNDDTRGLAQFISTTATKDDIVAIDVPFPFDYYYHGAAPAQYLFVDIHTTADVLTRLTQGRKRIFFISWYKSDTDPRGFVPYLLDKYAVFSGARAFRGYNVVWYQLPGDPQFALAPPPQPAAQVFGDQLALKGFAFGGVVTASTPDPDQARVAAGSKAWIALWWAIAQPVQKNYKVSIQLTDAKGNNVAQDDRMLINDRHFRTSLWRPDDLAINVYTPMVGAGVAPGDYTLNVIVYEPESGAVLGTGTGGAFPLGKVRVVP